MEFTTLSPDMKFFNYTPCEMFAKIGNKLSFHSGSSNQCLLHTPPGDSSASKHKNVSRY